MTDKPFQFHEGRISFDIAECHRIDIIGVILALAMTSMSNLYTYLIVLRFEYSLMKGKEITNQSIYNKNHKASYDTKWKGGMQRNKS